MKKTLYLSVLLGTSILATLIKIYNTFFAKLKASSGHSTGNIEIDALLSESRLVLERQHAFTTNGINKIRYDDESNAVISLILSDKKGFEGRL
ncbi:hypothetical protein [Streptococcus equi]|uniref:hypothetical protein n=1 Tax=Streptococcus equi TaxID=1336 RepID=UPI001E4E7AAD|nr:hypothetical protein [Streptococcus equi]